MGDCVESLACLLGNIKKVEHDAVASRTPARAILSRIHLVT